MIVSGAPEQSSTRTPSSTWVREGFRIDTTDDEGIRPRARAVALGNFDGVHLGHRAVVAGCDTVLTFDPHPLQVLCPQRAPRMLTDLSTKWRYLKHLGITEMVTIPFDRRWASMDASAFIDEILIGRLGVHAVRVGANFRFGAHGRGDVAMLSDDPRLRTSVASLVEFDAGVVSSSRIRGLISRGELRRAVAMLGRPYTLPLRMMSGHTLVGDASRCAPAPGRYTALVDGSSSHVTVRADGSVRTGSTPPAGVFEVSFLAEANE